VFNVILCKVNIHMFIDDYILSIEIMTAYTVVLKREYTLILFIRT